MMGQITNAAGSHLTILSKLCIHTNGHILELGAGYFSTPLLYWTAKRNNKIFRSYDTKKVWVRMLGEPVQLVRDWANIDLFEMHWTIAFIDHGDALKRKDHAIALKDKADFIVLHDTEPEHENIYGYNEVWEHFQYRKDFTDLYPHTTVLSNLQKLDWI